MEQKRSKRYQANFLRIHVLHENEGGRENTEQIYFLIILETRCNCKMLKVKVQLISNKIHNLKFKGF